jgi:hypothetical protein
LEDDNSPATPLLLLASRVRCCCPRHARRDETAERQLEDANGGLTDGW